MTQQAKRAYKAYSLKIPGRWMDWDDLPSGTQEAWRDAAAAAIGSPEPKAETLTDETETAKIGRQLIELLPPGKGFILLTFEFGHNGNLAYIANARRDDAIRVLRGWLHRQGAL